MKITKFSLGISIVLIFSVFFTSCELISPTDPCEDVTCLNGGICNEGTCDCPDGYTGADCGTIDITKVQTLLDNGLSPKTLFDRGVILDSLYGKMYKGGMIFFVNTDPSLYPKFSGEGMVTTERDYGDFDQWGCRNQLVGATDSAIGAGPANTQLILDAMCTDEAKSAKLIDALVHNGFDDWFMPSINELELIYHNLHLKGHSNFLGGVRRYQSSTEYDAYHFILRFFSTDLTDKVNKISGDDLRPCRIF